MSLTLQEARARAALIRVSAYTVDLDLRGEDRFASTTTITFDAQAPGSATFVELHAGQDVVARLNGRALPPEAYAEGRIALDDLAETTVLEVSATLPYVRDGDGMHRFVDPADDLTYVSAYCGMDIAQRVFACFDQPDLKATIALTVTAPTPWTVIANGIASREADRWSFTPTPRISTYLFVVCAGPWVSHRFDHAGLPFAWHARASQRASLERESPWLEKQTIGCFEAYTRYFEPAYPFDSYDQIFVPEHNWGALETPGAVTFQDRYLQLDPPTEPELAQVAIVIAHEMAHMWFGNLVTMRWWEDAWLNESFADYMGIRVGGEVSGLDVWTHACLDAIAAYKADRRRSSHPVAPLADDVPDVDAALGNFDALTYRKGRAALRQLVTWLGDDAFFDGVNRYLNAFAFGNASLEDFTSALAEAAPERDVHGWVAAWLRTTGFDTLTLAYDDGVPLIVREGSRPHRVNLGDGVFVDIDSDEPVRVPELFGRPVVPNSGDETYARVRFDDDTWAIRSREPSPDPVTRGVVLRAALDRVVGGKMGAAEFVGAWLPNRLRGEGNVELIDYALEVLFPQLSAWLAPEEVPLVRQELEVLGIDLLGTHPSRSVAVTAIGTIARHSTEADSLRELLRRNHLRGIQLTHDLRWAIVIRLAALGDRGTLAREASIDRSSEGALAARRARAALPTADDKSAAWAEMFAPTVSNREFEASALGFWTAGQEHLVAPWIPQYAGAAKELAHHVGPGTTRLIGYRIPWMPLPLATLTSLRDQLSAECENDLPTTLPRQWADSVDDLDVAIGVRAQA